MGERTGIAQEVTLVGHKDHYLVGIVPAFSLCKTTEASPENIDQLFQIPPSQALENHRAGFQSGGSSWTL